MPREYRHIQEYETEILRLRETGHSYREIGEKFGLTKKQIAKFYERYNEKQWNSFILRTENVKPMKPDSKNMTSWAPAVSVSYIVAPNRQYIKCFTNQKNRRQALYTVLRESSK